MDEGFLGLVDAAVRAIGWVALAIEIAIAVIAFIRLRFTASGILIGGGFAAITLVSLASRLARLVLGPALEPGGDAATVMFAASMTIQSLLWVLVAVGIVLIPGSLEKLARRR